MNKHLTLGEHKQLALNLLEMQDRIHSIFNIAIHTDKLKRRSRAAESIWKLDRLISNVKCLLDDEMYRDHPDAPSPSLYYTNGRQRWMPGETAMPTRMNEEPQCPEFRPSVKSEVRR